MQRFTKRNSFLFKMSLLSLILLSNTSKAEARIGRQMAIHRVTELGLEIWTEVEPEWETRLEKKADGTAPTFAAETPANTYPPAGMTWVVPGLTFSEQEFPVAAKGAVYQAARNYGLPETDAKSLPLKKASYGELVGYETDFSAT